MSDDHDDGPSWDGLLSGYSPREDREAPFPPDLLEDESPVFLSGMTDLVAALVSSRVLEIVARRGGAHHTPDAYASLRARLARALPSHVVNHAEAEAARVLSWLTDASPPIPETPATRQLEAMDVADLETRAGLVRYAMDAELELELEHHLPRDGIWERLRGVPEDLVTEPELFVVLRLYGDRVREVPLAHVRWVMPVEPRGQIRRREAPQIAEVVTFPGRFRPVGPVRSDD